LTQDYAKQRKLKDYLVNNVFDNEPTEAVKRAVQACSDKSSNNILNQAENNKQGEKSSVNG